MCIPRFFSVEKRTFFLAFNLFIYVWVCNKPQSTFHWRPFIRNSEKYIYNFESNLTINRDSTSVSLFMKPTMRFYISISDSIIWETSTFSCFFFVLTLIVACVFVYISCYSPHSNKSHKNSFACLDENIIEIHGMFFFFLQTMIVCG